MDSQTDFSFYQIYLEAGIKEIEPYLLSDDLFWPMNVSSPSEKSYPNLTLGGLLLYQRYARLLAVSDPQQNIYRKIETEIDVQRTRWRVAWEKKAAWEFQSRLRQWGHTLREIIEKPQENASYYRYEVRLRVLLSLLQPEVGNLDPAYHELLQSDDLRLQALLKPGEFIWDAELAPAFPKDEFWYLWGLPRELA